MTTVIDPISESVGLTREKTIAGLLDQLGGISAARVLLHPYPGTATEADFLRFNEQLGIACELVDQTLVEKGMGNRESLVAAVIVSILRAFVAPRKLGFVLGADSMFRLVPEQVRLPDVAFISLNRWPDGIPPAAISSIAPDLAVEVLSESNTTREMDRKRAEYFKSGTRLVWIVDPQERTVLVYISVDEFIPRSADQMIDGGDVLPGFQILVGDFFADLDLKATPLTK